MMRKPRPHQALVLQRRRDANRLGLFHEMRLGKSLTTIWWLNMKKDAKKILLVAPLSVLSSWENEFSSEKQLSVILHGSKEQRLELAMSSKARWHLVNPEGLTQSGHRRSDGKSIAVPSPICLLPWDAVVIDESTCLKNPASQLSRVCCQAFSRVKYRACLSGLPNPEDTMDFFQQMKFLNGSMLGCDNYYEFREKHFEVDLTGYGWWPRRGTESAIRASMEPYCEFLTRKDAGLGNERVTQFRTVQLPSKVRKELERAEKELAVGSSETVWPIVARSWALQLLGGRIKDHKEFHHDVKLNEMMDLINGELQKEQVVVWFRFTAELDAAMALLSRKGVPCGRIDGSVPRHERAVAMQKFKKRKLRVMCCQYKAAKYGIDLSSASTNIFFSMVESQEDYFQASERIESLSKSEPLLSIHLIVEDSLDEDIYKSLRMKNLKSRMFLRSVRQRMLDRCKKKEKS